jgi:citrate synthase
LFIHQPCPELSTAENILHLIRQDNHYTRTEVETLDILLVIHAEHGGGNNSAFATHVVSSSGTDTYSAIATAVGALKGPKHGGASIRVKEMMDDLASVVGENPTKEDVRKYLQDVIAKKAFNKEGLIYGMGHAVYTKSDPRAEMLKETAEKLAIEKDAMNKLDLYFMVEEQTKAIFKELKPDKFICANVDLYSGFVYEMLGIPEELYTPLFATARVSGWCAHRIEQILTDKKILRPAYKNVSHSSDYVQLNDR